MTATVEPLPNILLDTSAVSDALRDEDQSDVLPYLNPPHRPAISFQSESELLVWAQSSTISAANASQIRGFLRTATVIYADRETVSHHARIIRHRKNEDRDERVEDAWIAATALARDLPLVTLDKKGFNDIRGLTLILLPATNRR